MKLKLHLLLAALIAFMLQGCFIFSSGSSSSNTSSSTAQNNSNKSSYVTALCSHRWVFTRGVNEEYVYDKNCNFVRSIVREDKSYYNNDIYIQFYSDYTCVENRLWGGNGSQRRRWSLNGNKLTIYGNNMTVGEVVTNSATFTIESLSSNNLRMKRSNGSVTCATGREHFRTLYFK